MNTTSTIAYIKSKEVTELLDTFEIYPLSA